jgi:hypothetical protein
MHSHQEATGEEFIFVGTARVREYQGNHLLLLSMEILDSSTLDHSAFFGGGMGLLILSVLKNRQKSSKLGREKFLDQ